MNVLQRGGHCIGRQHYNTNILMHKNITLPRSIYVRLKMCVWMCAFECVSLCKFLTAYTKFVRLMRSSTSFSIAQNMFRFLYALFASDLWQKHGQFCWIYSIDLSTEAILTRPSTIGKRPPRYISCTFSHVEWRIVNELVDGVWMWNGHLFSRMCVFFSVCEMICLSTFAGCQRETKTKTDDVRRRAQRIQSPLASRFETGEERLVSGWVEFLSRRATGVGCTLVAVLSSYVYNLR